MKFKDFNNDVVKTYNNWLNHLINNRLPLLSINNTTLNNMIRFGESQDHFICEFFGSVEPRVGFQISKSHITKLEKIKNTNDFFIKGLRPDNSSRLFSLMDSVQSMSFVDDRFRKFANQNQTPLLPTVLGIGAFDLNSVKKYRYFKEITIGCYINNILAFRFINSAFVFRRSIKSFELTEVLNQYFPIPKRGMMKNEVSEDEKDFWIFGKLPGVNVYGFSLFKNFALQLQSLSLENIKESYIDSYFKNHSNLICSCFGYDKILDQVRLHFQDNPNYLIPDYVGYRLDGFCDILDLKKGIAPSKSLTRKIKTKEGLIKRVRFIDYVNELISQLQDYLDYFSNPENSQYAYDKYGIKINPKNVRLIGFVGNLNNFNSPEVKKALAPYKSNIYLISYGSFMDFLHYTETRHKK